MRLRGCVAIELLVGALISASVSGAGFWGFTELKAALAGEGNVAGRAAGGPAAIAVQTGSRSMDRLAIDLTATRPRSAAVETKLASAALTSGRRLPGAAAGAAEDPAPAPAPQPAWIGQFLGQNDLALLAPLRDSPVKAIKLNRGGSSLSLRIDFASGGRAACKPNQTHLQSQPRREVAAYRINRLLGLSSVPPTIGRRFRVDEIADHFNLEARADRARFLAESIPERADPTIVLGQLSWWVPVLRPALLEGFEIDTTEGIVTWKRYLTIGQDIPPRTLATVAQVSEMLLFDFIINNSDRWSGGNIKVSEGQGSLVFIDNTLSFGGDPNGHNRVRTYLYRSQKFSRRLVDRLRRLSEAELEDALTRDIDPFPVLLDRSEMRALVKRRDLALQYIDELIAKYGEVGVLAFP